MKNLFFTLLCVTVLLACDNNDVLSPPTQITAGIIDNDYDNEQSTDSVQMAYNQIYSIPLPDADTLQIRSFHMSSPGGYTYWVDINTGSNVQYIALADTTTPKQLADGALIDANANWQNSEAEGNSYLYNELKAGFTPLTITGEWANGQPGFIGFRVNKNNDYYYGWIKLKVDSSNSFTPLSWIYYRP